MNKLNIKEANEHLKQLHRRVIELENQVHMHAMHSQELEKTNDELRERLEAAEARRERELRVKDAETADALRRLSEAEERVEVLLGSAEERDKLVEELESKARLFYEVVEHRAILGRMVEILDDIHQQKEESSQKTTLAVDNEGEREVENIQRTSPADTNETSPSPPHTSKSFGELSSE